MSIDIEEIRADLQTRQVAPDAIVDLIARLQAEDGLFIVCPQCGRRRNFTRVLATVTDWEKLIPLLEGAWCQPCVVADTLRNLNIICVLTGHPGDPQEQEECTHYGFRVSRKRMRRF
jgi:hypothetical protein